MKVPGNKSVRFVGAFLIVLSIIACAGMDGGRQSSYQSLSGQEDIYSRLFGPEELKGLVDKLSESHKEQLIRESLQEKYVSGISYPYEIVYFHQYSLIRKDGSTVDYSDYAIRANTADGIKAVGEQVFPFRASRETVDIEKASVYARNGREINTDVASAMQRDPYTGLVYSDLKVKTLTLKGLGEGSVLRVITKETERTKGTQRPIFRELGLTNYLPAKEKIFVLRFEAGTEFRVKERMNGDVSKSILKKETTAANGDRIYAYALIGGRPQIPEPGSVPVQEFDSRVFFYTPSTWNEVAKNYYSSSAPKAVLTEEISAKVKTLSQGLSEREEKIKAVYDYVRSIRYVSILLNQHEVIPHEAGLTFRNGYGDCKDKAVLLVAMLKALGIDSSVALVNVTHLLDQELPSLSVFNHVIVAVPETTGAYFFLDATNPYTPYGLLPMYVQNRHVLVVGEKGGELTVIPPQAPDQNKVEEKIEVEFHDVESATIWSTALTTSSNEAYHIIPGLPRDVLQQMVRQAFASKYHEMDILDLKCDQPDKNGVLLTESKVKIRDFSKRTGNAYAFNALADADTIRDHGAVSLAERKTDIELEGPKRLIADISIRLPASVAVEYVPKPKSVRNEKFGEYSYEISRMDGAIKIHRELRVHAKRVSAENYEEFRAFVREVALQEEEMVLLKKK